MIVKNKSELFEFEIMKYEFNYNENSDSFDNNWLITRVRILDLISNKNYVDVESAEILASELRDLSKEVSKKTSFTMKFLEPYIEISVNYDSKKEEWIFIFLYNIDLSDSEVRILTKKFEQKEYLEFMNDIEVLSNKFPVR